MVNCLSIELWNNFEFFAETVEKFFSYDKIKKTAKAHFKVPTFGLIPAALKAAPTLESIKRKLKFTAIAAEMVLKNKEKP